MSTTAKEILESIPLRFRPEKAQGVNVVFYFDINGEGGGQYTLQIAGGECRLTKGLVQPADCIVEADARTYADLETGKLNPQAAFMSGAVKVSNLSAMMQLARCLRKWNVEATAIGGNVVSAAKRPAKSGPLAGVKIIDFTRLLPGPLATMFLADMGADVIKVEDPDRPDYIRDFEPQINGVSLMYLSLNRNKRSLAVNYLSNEGRQLLYDLIKNADVLVEQYRPGVMQEMGFGYRELQQINPRLIYVSITGYGQTGPMAMAAGHDLNYIAIAGALGITGTANAPVIPGFQLADIAGGGYMALNAVTAALYQREKTGKGEWVDVSMTDCVVPFSVLQFAALQGTGTAPGRGQFELSGALANYNIYKCADGRFIALGSLEPKFWHGFCKNVNRADWAERFVLKGEEAVKLKEEVSALFLTQTSKQWEEQLAGADICFTRINTLDELAADPLLSERHMFLENEHASVGKYKTINQPLKFKEATFENNWPAPVLGADTAAVLGELTYTAEKINDLIQKGIIK